MKFTLRSMTRTLSLGLIGPIPQEILKPCPIPGPELHPPQKLQKLLNIFVRGKSPGATKAPKNHTRLRRVLLSNFCGFRNPVISMVSAFSPLKIKPLFKEIDEKSLKPLPDGRF